ncbi:DOPA 4,5-dioxygenase family protein [Vibrio sonorensis]|uniref:DOPA 4,5-dioxygenase family protein n=1 Tax=Vibrio sonorensis TaxID=1004316 RepID=UPI0008DA606F|nr:DOPA 4,5-dioxygenase family protein [Vibrio sonorensis]
MFRNDYDDYHVHVYFDKETLLHAKALYQSIGEQWALPLGRLHERNVGPHPKWSFQVSVDKGHFENVVEWLDEHRNGLTVFIHASTGNALKDHTEHVYWLGEPVALNLDIFNE